MPNDKNEREDEVILPEPVSPWELEDEDGTLPDPLLPRDPAGREALELEAPWAPDPDTEWLPDPLLPRGPSRDDDDWLPDPLLPFPDPKPPF